MGVGTPSLAPIPAEPPRPALTSLPPQFGESQQLRMVRILRSTLMVRVGGGWIALDEFLVKNDPCRGGYSFPGAQVRVAGAHWCQLCSPPPLSPVKGRTNLKINEKYLTPDAFGAAAAKCAGNPSAPSSKVMSPSRSSSSLSLYSSASAPSSPLARKVKAGETPPRSHHTPSPAAAGADSLSLPSQCCGGRAPETGVPAPVAPHCPTVLSCTSAQPRTAWPWHPQVRD